MIRPRLLPLLTLLLIALPLSAEQAVLQRGPELKYEAAIPWSNFMTGWEAVYRLDGGSLYLFGLAPESRALYYGNFSACYEGQYEKLGDEPRFYYIEGRNGIQRLYLVAEGVEEDVIEAFINIMMERLLYFYIQAGNNNFPYPFPAILEIDSLQA